MINFVEGHRCMMARTTVYQVHTFMHEYVVDEVYIKNIIQRNPDFAPEFFVQSSATGEEKFVRAVTLFLDKSAAIAECKRLQREHGYVVISQKEYNELIALKSKFQQEK